LNYDTKLSSHENKPQLKVVKVQKKTRYETICP